MSINGHVWLSARQAAVYLGVSRNWLRDRRMTGKPPAFYRFGGRVRYVQADLDAWLASTKGP